MNTLITNYHTCIPTNYVVDYKLSNIFTINIQACLQLSFKLKVIYFHVSIKHQCSSNWFITIQLICMLIKVKLKTTTIEICMNNNKRIKLLMNHITEGYVYIMFRKKRENRHTQYTLLAHLYYFLSIQCKHISLLFLTDVSSKLNT